MAGQGYGLGGHIMCPRCEKAMDVVDWEPVLEQNRTTVSWMDKECQEVKVLFACKNNKCDEDDKKNKELDEEASYPKRPPTALELWREKKNR